MSLAFEILMATAMVGAADVLYFHLYRHRLFSRPASQLENVTHLVRHLIFIALTLGLLWGSGKALLVSLLVLDLVNSVIDLALERESRRSLDGLTPLESVLHGVAAVGMGAVLLAVVQGPTSWELSSVQHVRGAVTVVLGLGLFGAESFMVV
jgi:hypothetical protein